MMRLAITVMVPLAAGLAIFTLPIWGMAPAAFLDSERTVLSRAPAPNGTRVAQVERLIVGGVPHIVVLVRANWSPDWYLAGCVAASHYRDDRVSVRWLSDAAIEVTHQDARRFWNLGRAPFHREPCTNLTVRFYSRVGQPNAR